MASAISADPVVWGRTNNRHAISAACKAGASGACLTATPNISGKSRADLPAAVREAAAEGELPGSLEAEATTAKTGVALILDIDNQAARTALRSGRSISSIAGSHRSLKARDRSCTMC